MSFQQLFFLVPLCVWVWITYDFHLTHVYPARLAPGGNEGNQERCHYKVLGFQIIAATAESSFLFDAAGQPGIACHACPHLCQIKGQRLDREATLLFIPVQSRERPGKSGGNVVTWELERSLPTGRGKWRDSLSLNLLGYVFFPPKCHFHTRVIWPASLRPPLIRSLIILCLFCQGF